MCWKVKKKFKHNNQGQNSNRYISESQVSSNSKIDVNRLILILLLIEGYRLWCSVYLIEELENMNLKIPVDRKDIKDN